MEHSFTRKEDGSIVTGSIPLEEACEKASEATVKAYGIMEVKGTPQQLWKMIGY